MSKSARPVYYAKVLLGDSKQIKAADMLIGTLLLRAIARGVRGNYFAYLWERPVRTIANYLVDARIELEYRRRKVTPEGRRIFIPDPIALERVKREQDTLGPLIDEMEKDSCEALDDKRVEALIRGMFTDDPPAIYAARETRPPKANVKRPRGRPKGSKNKPKTLSEDDDGWLMPDGRRIPGISV